MPNTQIGNNFIDTSKALSSLSGVLAHASLSMQQRGSGAGEEAKDMANDAVKYIEASRAILDAVQSAFSRCQSDHSTMVGIIAAYRHRIDVQLRDAQSNGAVCVADAIELVDLLGDAITGKMEHAAQSDGAKARALAIQNVGLTYVSSGVSWGPAPASSEVIP